MKSFSITDTGRVRNNNQDCVLCEENAVGCFPNLFIVADGMGGHNAGDTASKMCVRVVSEQISISEKRTPVGVFEEAVMVANQQIHRSANENVDYAGMGTTMVATTIFENVAYVVNVGDSRLYQYSGELKQITVDHSLVEEMVQSGELRKDEMRTHPNKNIITRALGTDTSVRPDCFEIGVKQGDVLLLCSDGLSNMLEDEAMEEVLKKNGDDLEQAARTLVDQANEAGGKDNISVVLISI
ncbi:MAG: Stp1/IreP family PP2C-type Ser/Thr phosphatase [Eubacterium sp.]|nr:Stp1/IreP family PP2C-type Ser/Thr phosphatase [Eubacterium sp.]